eukprot:6465534-Amphidinium_carterae.2
MLISRLIVYFCTVQSATRVYVNMCGHGLNSNPLLDTSRCSLLYRLGLYGNPVLDTSRCALLCGLDLYNRDIHRQPFPATARATTTTMAEEADFDMDWTRKAVIQGAQIHGIRHFHQRKQSENLWQRSERGRKQRIDTQLRESTTTNAGWCIITGFQSRIQCSSSCNIQSANDSINSSLERTASSAEAKAERAPTALEGSTHGTSSTIEAKIRTR